MKREIKICDFCHKEIDLKNNKYVLIGTYDKKKPISEPYFHFQCFVEWYNKKVQEKAQNILKNSMGKAMGMLKGITSGNMFGQQEQVFDLTKETQIEIPDYTQEIKEASNIQDLKEKKNNGRKKKMLPM